VVKIDLGCGSNKREGFTGVDQYAMPGVDVLCDLGKDPWPWDTDSVDEAHCSHFLEHLTNFNGKWERVHFFNELHRVLKPGASCTLVIPHWNSNRFYGDPTHCEPFSEMGFYYLSKEWRAGSAPHADVQWNPQGYACDFECTWGYSMHQALMARSPDHQQYALGWFKEAAQDIHANLKKR
jgi:SAM-dependent methyltransferase